MFFVAGEPGMFLKNGFLVDESGGNDVPTSNYVPDQNGEKKKRKNAEKNHRGPRVPGALLLAT